MRRFIMRIHPLLDYMLGSALLLPYVCGFYVNAQETWILGVTGFLIIAYSSITDYRGGAIKILPLNLHKTLDVFCGLYLVIGTMLHASFPYKFYWPVSIGIALILAALISYPKAYSLNKKDNNITQPL